MNKPIAYLILILAIVITLPIFFITIPLLVILYNGLVKKRNHVEFSFSGVDVALQNRGELIPNLVASVKAYMFHEKSTLHDITALRNKLLEVDPQSSKRFGMENELTGLLKNLMVTVESYPDLKASENMLHLQRSLNEMEEKISASRRAYNAAVMNLNNTIETFPSNVMASVYNFKMSPFFKADESARAVPILKEGFNK
jgi:LemA protein